MLIIRPRRHENTRRFCSQSLLSEGDGFYSFLC